MDTDSISSAGAVSASNGGGGGGAGSLSGDGGTANLTQQPQPQPESVLIRIRVPELKVEKCLQFQKDELIWEVKQQCLAALPKELQESFNYGLFYPPSNGRAGKFLDEERRLTEYPFSGPIGYLELKYKRRVYKMLQMDEKQLKNINSRANHKKFIDAVNGGNVEKVNKMTTKGLDSNFHCQDNGETPLCVAAGLKVKSARMIIALVNGGAIVDFRTKDGSTAMHRAVARNNSEALRTLLDLGASPNYKDGKGLSPLYHAVASSADVNLVEILLHDHAHVGIQDLQGWHEVHQACRNGLVQHLEHLLFYGAEMNARNASGNTPLHVCAVNNQESCARILLFRGADRDALNYAGQTPYQVAVIAGNLELAEVIQNHRPEDIVPYKNAPKFNPKRRTSGTSSAALSRTASNASTMAAASSASTITSPPPSMTSSSLSSSTATTTMGGGAHPNARLESPLVNSLRISPNKPPSPSPSDRSIPPFSSGSSVSETTSTGSGGSATVSSNRLLTPHLPNHNEDDEQLDSASTLAASLTNDPHGETVSLSSGVGTSSQSGSAGGSNGSSATPTLEEVANSGGGGGGGDGSCVSLSPGMHVVCLESYSSKEEEGTLQINQGDIIQVTGSTDSGMLEGVLRGVTGLFPAQYVQEVRLRNPDSLKQAITTAPRVAGRRELRTEITSTTVATGGRPYTSSTPRSKVRLMGLEPRTTVLHKGKKGFGFVLRGAKAASPLMEMIPSEKCPGLQYMDDVDPGGVADLSGIKKGDFLLSINGIDVTQASHETVVGLIRKSGDVVALTVVTVTADNIREMESSSMTNSVNASPSSNTSKARGYSTLPRKMQGRSMVAPPPPPKRDPSTTLSVGRAKARSMVANLAALEVLDRAISEHDSRDSSTSESMTGSVDSVQRMPDLSASSTPSPSQQQKQQNGVVVQKESPLAAKENSPSTSPPPPPPPPPPMPPTPIENKSINLKKDFHSTPTLNGISSSPIKKASYDEKGDKVKRKVHSQEDINKIFNEMNLNRSKDESSFKNDNNKGYFTLPSKSQQKKMMIEEYRTLSRIRPVITTPKPVLLPTPTKTSPSSGLPPPEHPPPPPPTVSQVVKVETTGVPSDYAKVENKINSPTKKAESSEPPTSPAMTSSVMSSFKPSDNAKLYASPENIQPVGYRIAQKYNNLENSPIVDPINGVTTVQVTKKRSPTRANSMPPRPKPLMLRKEPVEVDQHREEPKQQDPISLGEREAPAGAATVETYSVNGVKYTTYTTFRSPITPEDGPLEDISSRQFDPDQCDEDEPIIPEPDYDLSDSEDRKYSAMTLEKKKKKSVSFVMNEEMAAKLQAGKTTRQESILKDPNKQQQQQQTQPPVYTRALSFDTTMMSSSYSSSPTTTTTTGRSVSFVEQLIPQAKLKPKKDDSNKVIRIDVDAGKGVPASAAAAAAAAAAARLTKSQSFSADKVSPSPPPPPPTATKPVMPSKSSPIKPVVLQTTTTTNTASTLSTNTSTTSGGISVIDIKNARSQLKPSRSFPNEFTAAAAAAAVSSQRPSPAQDDQGDNSSSGVSSDQEVNSINSKKSEDSDRYVTYLPVDGPVTNKIHVVPPPPPVQHAPQQNPQHQQVKWENDSESSDDVSSSDKSWVLRAEQDASGQNIISMKKMLHPKLQALFDLPNTPQNASRTLPNLKHHHPHHHHQHVNIMEARHRLQQTSDQDSAASSMSSSSSSSTTSSKHHKHGGVNRSIEESLALIQQHVTSLGEVNNVINKQIIKTPVIPPPPPTDGDGDIVVPEVLAPPPGFSDSDSEDQRSGRKKLGFTKASKSRSTATSTEQHKKERLLQQQQQQQQQHQQHHHHHHHHHHHQQQQQQQQQQQPQQQNVMMSRSIDYGQLGSDYGTLPRGAQREFRSKQLSAWTVADVCEWLDSLFMSEYKPTFAHNRIDGRRLTTLTKADLEKLGVNRVGHMLNIEKSLKRYVAIP